MHTRTLMRQLLDTTCFGSTTSTSGSWIATRLMHDMSNPCTLSHPKQYRNNKEQHTNTDWTKEKARAVLTVDLVVFVLSVFDGAHVQSCAVRKQKTTWRLRQKTIYYNLNATVCVICVSECNAPAICLVRRWRCSTWIRRTGSIPSIRWWWCPPFRCRQAMLLPPLSLWLE